jgi:hypothetical protein
MAHVQEETTEIDRGRTSESVANLFMRCEACLQAEVVTFNTCYKAL